MKIKSIFFSTIYLFILIVYPSQASAQTEQELTVTITRLTALSGMLIIIAILHSSKNSLQMM
jgi:hypothetical protein